MDSRTNQQRSLETKDRSTAQCLLEIKRQTDTHDGFNQLLLKTCLTASDSMLTRRTWADVVAEMKTHGRDSTRLRCARAMDCSAFKSLKPIGVFDTMPVSENFRLSSRKKGNCFGLTKNWTWALIIHTNCYTR